MTERIALIAIDQPQCARTYGSSPCQAVLGSTGAHKCHNTRFTCQDPANYRPGTAQSSVTVTLGSPYSLINWSGHGLEANTPVRFENAPGSPTGTLPVRSGSPTQSLVSGTKYYVVPQNANAFAISDAPDGTPIMLITTGSNVYAVAEVPLTFYLARAQDGLHKQYNAIPSVDNYDTAPAALNLGAMDATGKISPLGQRESVTIKIVDHKHSDAGFDKYRLERKTGAAQSSGIGYDPYQNSTFWPKWIARNPYHASYPIRVYEGEMGDSIDEMRVRHYIIDRIEGPNNGELSIVAKDLLSIIEDRKAVAPAPSTGELLAGITAVSSSFTLSPSGIGNDEYPTSGYVNVGDEIIQFTRSGDVMTAVLRGALGTAADTHDAEDLVQLVLEYSAERAHDIAQDLLLNYAAVPQTTIDAAEWELAAEQITELLTARIPKPTPVEDLLAELSLQVGFTLFHDVSANMLRFSALRAKAPELTIDDADWIIDKSISVKRQDTKRLSQVWVYFGQVNPVEDLTDPRNFRSRVVVADASAEAEDKYGVQSIKPIFSRWFPQFARNAAEDCANRLIAMFTDAPTETTLSVHPSREPEVELAQYVTLDTDQIVDEIGGNKNETHAITQIERNEEVIVLSSQRVLFDEDGDGEKIIYIEDDAPNFNLRTTFESLYGDPVDGDRIRCVIVDSGTAGATSTSNWGFDTGTWTEDVTLYLDIDGEIQGMGGRGGNGGEAQAQNGQGASGCQLASAASNGLAGGPALKIRHAITISGTGAIRAGGGGGSGSGGAAASASDVASAVGGSSGGGGRGFSTSSPGSVGNGVLLNASGDQVANTQGLSGTSGNRTGAGTGGGSTCANFSGTLACSGVAGNGGDWGTAGSGGNPGSNNGTDCGSNGSGATGGAAGNAIEGIAFVTWGSPTGFTGTINGAQV